MSHLNLTTSRTLETIAITDTLWTFNQGRPIAQRAAAPATGRAPDPVEPIGGMAIAVAVLALAHQVLSEDAPVALAAIAIASAGAFLAWGEG